MSLREAAQQALEALQYPLETSSQAFDADKAELLSHRAIDALRAALAEPKQGLTTGEAVNALYAVFNAPHNADINIAYLNKILDDLVAKEREACAGMCDFYANKIGTGNITGKALIATAFEIRSRT